MKAGDEDNRLDPTKEDVDVTSGTTTITWLGHAAVLITSPRGKRILIDPWVETNPATPADAKQIGQLDLVLITHGHGDHLGDAVSILRRTNARAVCIFELGQYLQMKGVSADRIVGMNKGGTVHVDGIDVTMVHATHSGGFVEDGKIIYLGEPAGFVVRLENGLTLYHAGDTAVFADMRLIGEQYHPDLAMLPIGGHYTMDPRGAAAAVRLLGVKRVLPIHYGTFPVLTGTPDQLRAAAADIPDLIVHALKPGGSMSV